MKYNQMCRKSGVCEQNQEWKTRPLTNKLAEKKLSPACTFPIDLKQKQSYLFYRNFLLD